VQQQLSVCGILDPGDVDATDRVSDERKNMKENQVGTNKSFSDWRYADHAHLAERELFAFVCAVVELFGFEQAEISAEDWLDESELIDAAPRCTDRDWRSITVAASARLARRLDTARYHRMQLGLSLPGA
jgi:hypothetical protein